MRPRFLKYGKSVKLKDGGLEHMEISIEIQAGDNEEEVLVKAKEFVAKSLGDDEKG